MKKMMQSLSGFRKLHRAEHDRTDLRTIIKMVKRLIRIVIIVTSVQYTAYAGKKGSRAIIICLQCLAILIQRHYKINIFITYCFERGSQKRVLCLSF